MWKYLSVVLAVMAATPALGQHAWQQGNIQPNTSPGNHLMRRIGAGWSDGYHAPITKRSRKHAPIESKGSQTSSYAPRPINGWAPAYQAPRFHEGTIVLPPDVHEMSQDGRDDGSLRGPTPAPVANELPMPSLTPPAHGIAPPPPTHPRHPGQIEPSDGSNDGANGPRLRPRPMLTPKGDPMPMQTRRPSWWTR